jgi:hypothetical protein
MANDFFKNWTPEQLEAHNRAVEQGRGRLKRLNENQQTQPQPSHTPDRVAHTPEPQHSIAPEQVAPPEREAAMQRRCLVRITSFRVKPTDDDNIYWKDLLDALTKSGAIFDDSPQWIKIERQQVKVEHRFQERTEVEIEPIEEA